MESLIAQVGFGFRVVMDELELRIAGITGVHHNNCFQEVILTVSFMFPVLLPYVLCFGQPDLAVHFQPC